MASGSIPDYPDIAALSAVSLSGTSHQSVLGHARKSLIAFWRRSQIFSLLLGRHARLTDIQSPAGPTQPGNPALGDQMMRGEFEFFGLTKVSDGAPPWMLDAPDDWYIMLHSFCWLDDLASSSHREQARQLARDLIVSWCTEFWSWTPLPWEPAVMGARLYHILQHHDNFLASAANEVRSTINTSLIRQALCLVRDIRRPLSAATQIIVIRGLTAAACAFPMNERLQRAARQAISDILPETLTNDGVTLDRCPEAQVCLINHLIEIRRLARSREWPEWAVVHHLLGVATPALKYVMLNDGSLPLMRGSGRSDRRAIHRLLKQSEWQSLWADRVNGWQILRAKLGEVTAFLDVGGPTSPLNSALETRAPLALEICIKAQPVITGCGIQRTFTSAESNSEMRSEIGSGSDNTYGSQGGRSQEGGSQESRSQGGLRGSRAHSTASIGSWATESQEDAPDQDHSTIQGPKTWRAQQGDIAISEMHQTISGGWSGRVAGAAAEHHRTITLSNENTETEDPMARELENEDSEANNDEANSVNIFGSDMLNVPKGCSYSLSFHLHPDIRVYDGETEESIRLKCPDGSLWIFKSRGRIWVDDSIYNADGLRHVPTRQLVIRGESRGAWLQIDWTLKQGA